MWFRFISGISALGGAGLSLQFPKESYAILYDASNWVTGLFVADGAFWGIVKNGINIIIVDQFSGFLFGVAFATLISFLFWPIRVVGRKSIAAVRNKLGRNSEE